MDAFVVDDAGRSVCAECKRLKLRCDRNVPCSACLRRRCANVCPDGTVGRGRVPGRRLLLIDSHELHVKIDIMRSRVIELEEAIAVFTSEKHSTPSDIADSHRGSDIDISNLFGTLTIGDVSDFMGPHASADNLLYRKNRREMLEISKCVMAELLLKHCTFDVLVPGSQNSASILMELPEQHVAQQLIDKYFDGFAWLFGGVSQSHARSLLSVLYRNTLRTQRPRSMNGLGMHDIAVLFSIFSITALLEAKTDKTSFEYRRNMILMSTCLSIDQCVERVTIQSVRALHLICWALHMSDDPYLNGLAYNLVGLNANMCRTLGLHRDDAGWSLSEEEKQIRRGLVWDVAALNTALSEYMGRPSSWPLAHFDARLPFDDEGFVQGGELQQSYTAWFRSFISSCMLRVFEMGFCARPQPYECILQLDCMIRRHPMSSSLRTNFEEAPPTDVPVKIVLQRAVALFLSQKVLLYLHRNFFARAMLENPDDPLKTAFQPSVLASFRAALYLTTAARTLYEQAHAAVQIPFLWSAAFTSCVVLGSIVISSTRSTLAPSAWAEFERTVPVFERIAPESPTVTRVLSHLRMLHQKAKASWEAAQQDASRQASPCNFVLDADEMAFIYGHTHVMQQSDTDVPPPDPVSTQEPPDLSTAQPDVAEQDLYRLDDDAWNSFMGGFGLPPAFPAGGSAQMP